MADLPDSSGSRDRAGSEDPPSHDAPTSRTTVVIATLTVAVSRAGRAGRRGARAVGHRIRRLFTSGGVSFRDLGVAHASSTAGDTLVTLALAGTLFFSVPSSEARGNVALYLLLTVAPFAVIGPALGRLLDRSPATYRYALVGSAAGRALLAVLLAWGQDSFWLFPAAFGILVLSRSHGISRNALLPVVLAEPVALVTANARMAQIGVLAGVAAAPVGALAVQVGGASAGLILALGTYVVAAVAGRRLPGPAPDEPVQPVPAPPRQAAAVHTGTGASVPATRILTSVSLPRGVRLAQLATAVVRFLNGFLLLLLAFAFRDVDAPLLDFGALLAAGGGGFALASVVSPYLESRLREEPMVVAALAVEAAAAFITGQWFGLPAAAVLAAAAGFSWGTAKLAFDGLLQANVPAERRGVAFTRSETLFQLAWVIGAFLPTGLPLPTEVGLVAAGLAALTGQVIYVAYLLLPDGTRPPA